MGNFACGFIQLKYSPYWDRKNRHYYGTFSAPHGKPGLELNGIGLQELVELIMVQSHPSQAEMQILVSRKNDAAAKSLEKELKARGYVTRLSVIKAVDKRLPDSQMNNGDLLQNFDESVRRAFYSVGIKNCRELAVFPPATLAALTQIPIKKCTEYTAIGAFLLVEGMEYRMASALVRIMEFNCLEALIKADAVEVAKKLNKHYVKTDSGQIGELQKNAVEAGPHLFLSVLLSYTPEQMFSILHELGSETLAARLSLLTKTFASADGSISIYQTIVESLVGKGVIDDRQKLLAFLKGLENGTEDLRQLRKNLQAMLKASFTQWDAPNSIRTLTGIRSKDIASLFLQGIYTISDLRIIDPAQLSPLCKIDVATLERYKQMADLKSLPAVSSDLAYVITDLNLWSEGINSWQKSFHWISTYKWSFDLPLEKQFWFQYAKYKDKVSPLVTRAGELLEKGTIREAPIYKWDEYLLNVTNNTATHCFLRLGIQGPDLEYSTRLSYQINLYSRDICSRLVPVPLTDYMQQAETFCTPVTLKIEKGPWRITLPDIKGFKDTFIENFFRNTNNVGLRLAAFLGCETTLTKEDSWKTEYKNKRRSIRLQIPGEANRGQIRKLIGFIEQAFWEELEFSEGYITGIITDPAGRPQSGVKVRLMNMPAYLYFKTIPQERHPPEMTTNESGRYSFRVAHQKGFHGAEGRGAIIQLDYPGYTVSNGCIKLIYGEQRYYDYHHIATPLNAY